MIKILKKNQIFVFGSNTAGRHGKGGAKTAHDYFGAQYGVGIGRTGQCYAIPTKDDFLKTLPLKIIKLFVNDFIVYAKNNPQKEFLITKIGCGLAGYQEQEIQPLFMKAKKIKNIQLPEGW